MQALLEYLLGKTKSKQMNHLEVDFNNFDNTCKWLDSLGFKKVKKFSKETSKNKPEYSTPYEEMHGIGSSIYSYFIGNDEKEYSAEFHFGHSTWARLIYFVMHGVEKRFVKVFVWEPNKENQEDDAKKIVKFIEENV